MSDNNTKRLPRLVAILTHLQTRRVITANSLAEKFNVSVRTIYRDIRTLEQAGVPIFTEEGKGYSIVEGYRIPPIMFTENEANALVTAGQFVQNNSDASLIKHYDDAINKIKSVLQYSKKEKIELLEERIAVKPKIKHDYVSNNLTIFQNALTDFQLLEISYTSDYKKEKTVRQIEPFGLFNNVHDKWTLVAYCRLRNDFRLFRLERIESVKKLDIHFKPHKMTLIQFIEDQIKKHTNP